ncbi:hypothetical protein RvY_06291 [Ramazzottius varieornatus]|uniref:Glutathione S-transferase omega n=1 Tax=Ramazzottius varieornatus TaxID=947166 RepID=A0A1D1V1J8_RAMVA|nr:hypothetical protein RvY_06291 [Ramazzottius varieornatus]
MVIGDIPGYGKGSKPPPHRAEEPIRLYSMRFCPFAHRVRLVLAYKQLLYEVVNIDLKDKPDWYLQVNPLGKVPLLEEDDNKRVFESTNCAEYLDDKFNDRNKLLPAAHPLQRAQQKMMVEVIHGKIAMPHMQLILKGADEQNREALAKALDEIEAMMVGPYLFGDSVTFVDLMVWPWFERIPAIEKFRQVSMTSEERHPQLTHWCKLMREEAAVQATSYPADLYVDFFRTRDFNTGLSKH